MLGKFFNSNIFRHCYDNNEVKIFHRGMLFDAEVFNVSKQQIIAKTLALIDTPKSDVHRITS